MSLDARGRWWALPLTRFCGGPAQILSLVLATLLFVFWLLLGDQLFSVGALQSRAFQLPELGILSLAMMIALLSGGLNLSIIASANLCALAMAWVLTTEVAGAQGFMWVGCQAIAVLVRVAVGTIVGLINGFVIAYLGVSPILATLGTMTMCKGLSIGLTRGNVISGFPDPIVFLGNGTLMGVPVALLIFLLLCALEATRIPLSSYATQLKPLAKLIAIAALAGIGLLTAEVMAAGFSALLDGRLAPVFDARDAAQRALDDSHGRIDRLTAEAAAARASLTQLSSHPPVLAEVRSQTCLGRRGRSYDCTPSAALRGNASAQASYDSRLKQAQDAVGEAERRLQADPGLKAEEEVVRASEARLRTATAANPMARLVSGLSDATIDRVKSIIAVSLGFAVAFTSLLAFLARLQPRGERSSKLSRVFRAWLARRRRPIYRDVPGPVRLRDRVVHIPVDKLGRVLNPDTGVS